MNTATSTRASAWGQRRKKWDLTQQERRILARIPAKIDFIDHPSFASPAAEQDYFGKRCKPIKVPSWAYFPEVPEDVHGRPRARATLKAPDEAQMFLRYNYARFRLSALIEAQDRRATAGRAKKMVLWFQRAMKTRAALARANMALVLAMAKRTRIPNVEFNELISEGNMALLRSIEKFDVSRGFKFSTYACRAILKSFHRLATKTGRYRQRFCTEYDPNMERSDYDEKKHEMQHQSSLESLREILAQNKAALSPVEHRIVMERFAIGSGQPKGHTLAEVGKMVGLTNERVRQIQNLALAKIRSVLDEEYLVT